MSESNFLCSEFSNYGKINIQNVLQIATIISDLKSQWLHHVFLTPEHFKSERVIMFGQ